MSADNGIYILRTIRDRKEEPKGHWIKSECHYIWRVAYAQAIDNFDWYQNKEPHNLGAYMLEVWGNSPVFLNEDEAFKYALELGKQYDYLEYGISSINTDFKFFEDL